MLFNLAYGLLVAVFVTGGTATATCSSNLLIDDFARFSSSLNALGTRASDDGSMTSLALSSSGGGISFVPEKMSYFYETLPCTRAAAEGYNAVSFTMKAPRGASFMLEIQTRESCDAAEYRSAWYTVSDFTGETQTITVPLSAFGGANTDAITAFNWATWSKWCKKSVQWELGDIQLVCSGAAVVV
ncbi:hypothetical protein DL769_004991 [Monosporascus sp. CRB-8-3]|nr:hypothetical protein DL769_004991 [Monosporascus sp. CRB-8-3]